MKRFVLIGLLLALLFPQTQAQSPGNALDFDGSNDLVNCILPGVFDSLNTRSVTVEAWIFPRAASFSRIVYAQQSTSNFFNFAYGSQQSIWFYVTANGSLNSATTTANSVPLNTWTHIACRWTVSNNAVDIFINGVLATTTGGGSSTTGSNGIMSIGSRPGGAQYFNGQMDEVRVWREARSDCEIAGNYQAEFAGPVTNLVAYYDFNEGTAGGTNTSITALPDQSGFGNNGTLSGFSLTGTTSNWIASTASINILGPAIGGGYTVNDTVAVCPGAMYTFPDNTTQTITSMVTQTSVLTATNLCDSTINTTVLLSPTFSVSDSVVVCPGTMYTFPDGSVQTITTPTTQTSNLQTINSCDSTVVTFVSLAPTYSSSDTVEVCFGGSYTFPDSTVQTNIISPTTYTSFLSTSQGCDSVIVTFLGVIPISNVQDSAEVCLGSSYTFPDGSTQNNITTPVTYTSNLTSSQGCDSIVVTNLSIVPIDTAVTVSGTTPILSANQVNATYQWLDCNNNFSPIQNATMQTFAPSTSGSYAVAITVNGCTDTSGCSAVTVVGIEHPSLTSIKLYPNPASDQIKVATGDLHNTTLQLMDLRGKILGDYVTEEAETIIDLQHISEGIYFIRVSSIEGNRTLRFSKH